MPERRDQLLAALALTAAVASAFLPWSDAYDIARGRKNLSGQPTYTPAQPPGWQAVDLAHVHRDLLPAWTIAAAQPGDFVDQQREAEAWLALSEALAPDPNLLALASDMRGAVQGGVWVHHDDLVYWMWAWSRYLEAPGWRLEGGVRDPGDGAYFYVKTYQVVADTHVPLHGAERRVRLLRRADHTSTTENYLGHAGGGGGEGALLLAHRIQAFAVDHLWPLMDPALDGRRTGAARAWDAPVRAEIQAALSPAHARALQQGAARRQQMLAVRDQVHQRTDCSGFHIRRVDWKGFSDTLTARLERAVARDADAACPAITAEELAVLSARPETEGLEGALEALVAFAARATALHEAQHLADREDPPACASAEFCAPFALGEGATGELSAYLTSFSSAEVGATAFYQACRATHHGTGSHARAVSVAARALLPRGCTNPPPADLTAQAQAMRAAWQGEDKEPRLSPGFPTLVALSAD